MYNVVIVDDEPVIRVGLKASVNWEQEGLRLLGDFPNGEKALEAMKNSHVDILITDIKMPLMDGITLMKKTLKIFPKVKVVLVSSFNDFEYVREGLMHGAIDYILKPTLEPEDFLLLIKRCTKKLKEDQQIDEKLTKMEQSDSIRERKKVEHEIKLSLLNEKEELDVDGVLGLKHGPSLMVLMTMNQVEKVEQQFGFLYKSLLLEEIQEQFYIRHKDGICFPINQSDMLFLMPATINAEQMVRELKQTMDEESEVKFSFGYDVINQLEELESGFANCLAASKRRFFYYQEEIFCYEPPKETNVKRLKAEQLKQFLLPFDEQKVKGFLQDRYLVWETEEMDPTEIKDEACDMLTNLFQEKVEISVLLDKCIIIKKAETLHNLYRKLLAQIDELNHLIAKKGDKAYADNNLMETAVDYIHKYYTQELTLQSVATHIHISRNYFSILFKKYIKQNFIDYVIDLRIKKAKELLVLTNLKVYEVAEKSGFNDVKYFSKLFKKVTGLSPGDYRTEKQKSM